MMLHLFPPAARFVRVAALVATLGVGLPALTPSAAQAQDNTWRDLTVSQGNATYLPRVAYDGEGFAHVVFFSGKTQSDWDIYYSNNRGGAWAAPRQISDTDKAQQRNPDIAIGADGHIHVIYQKNAATNQIWYVESPNLGASWGTPLNLSNTPGRSYEPAITADASGGAHAVWIDSRWSSNLTATYAFKPAGGAWSGPIKAGSGGDFEKDPDIAATGRGTNVQAHIVYQGRRAGSNSTKDFDIWYVSGAGGAFGKPVNFTRDGKWSLTPTITTDGGSGLFLAWDSDENYHDIMFAYSNNAGASWSKRQNVYSRSTPGITPALGYGLFNGTPKVHLAWSEGDTGKRVVLYLGYNAATNSFGPEIEKASDSGTLDAAVAGSPVTNEVSVVYRDKSLRAVVSSRGAGAFIGAGLELDIGPEPVSATSLGVTLRDLQGDPVEMRYAFDRAPDASDPWQPIKTSFRVTVPETRACLTSFSIQFRTADARTSPPFSRIIQIDNALQARVQLQGDREPIADPFHTRGNTAFVGVTNDGECAGLRRLVWNGQSPIDITNEGLAASLPLPGGDAEGPRGVQVRVEDALGNQESLSRTIVVDRTPPVVVSGTLSIPAPASGLPSVLATLIISNAVVTDNLYPDGRWGVLIANRPLSDTRAPGARQTSDDPTLAWRPVQLSVRGGQLTIRRWDVLNGITEDLADRSMAGEEIEVLVKFIDGAGNRSARTLSTIVRLAPDYRPIEALLPVIIR